MFRKYHVTLHSQMGPKKGTLMLKEDCGAITGTLCLLSHELPVSGSRAPDGRLCLDHQVVTAVSTYPCRSVLRDTGGTLSGELRMDPSKAPWSGGKPQPEVIMTWSGEQFEETEAESH